MSDNRFNIDPADEMLLTTDREGNVTGTATRKDCHTGNGLTHWAILAVVKRSNGNIILAQRSAEKSVFPLIWDASVATHVLEGDTPETAAQRETKEELGIDVTFQRIGDYFYEAKDGEYCENEYCSLLVGISDEEVNILKREVAECIEMTMADLSKKLIVHPEQFSPWMHIAFQRYMDVIATT